MKKKRIVIIEPSPVIRQGMKSLLEGDPDFFVDSLYDDLQEFQDNRQKSTIDIILINPAIINFYKQFNVRIVFSDYPDTIIVAILSGYVDSGTLNSFDEVLDIYDEPAKMIKKLQGCTKTFNNLQNRNSNDNVDLSEREKEILIAVAKGMTNKEIADKHFISVHTVISHRKNITRKTGIKTVSGLVMYAMFNNLIVQE
jgi:Response regulator containing a CheY-like receiver domain and an HTH DNA-binding domain